MTSCAVSERCRSCSAEAPKLVLEGFVKVVLLGQGLETSEADPNLLARRLAWRARLLLQAGRSDAALRDARTARALNGSVQLPDEPEARL